MRNISDQGIISFNGLEARIKFLLKQFWNRTVIQVLGVTTASKLRWIGHVVRMSDDRIVKKRYWKELLMVPTQEEVI